MDYSDIINGLDGASTLDMNAQSLEGLEIRPGAENLHYFYDSSNRRLIKDFKLSAQPRVAVYCAVKLVARGDKFSPRVRVWKRDLTKRAVADLEAGKIRGGHIIKGLVDTGDGHENFMELMAYIVSLSQVEVKGQPLRAVEVNDDAVLEALRHRSRGDLLPLIQAAIDGPLTEVEIAALSGRKGQLEEFRRLLHEDGYIEELAAEHGGGVEAVWQRFFEGSQWIFGYGLELVSHEAIGDGKLERITVGNNLWTGGGSRSDAVMYSKAQISTLLFCEIKRHDTLLLKASPYRAPDVYAPSSELVGGVAQLQKTVRKAIRLLVRQIEEHTEADGTPAGLEFSTSKPRQVLIAGRLDELRSGGRINGEMVESFELFRRANLDVDIVTFDELYQRARFIVEG